MKNSKEYKSLPAKTSQSIIKLLDKSWKSFLKSIKNGINTVISF